MILSSTWFRLGYFLLLILVVSINFIDPFSEAYAALKPLLMSSLFFVLVRDTKGIRSPLRYTALAALLASLAGDVFLLPHLDSFLIGLLCFLLAHIFYIVSFLQVPARPLEIPFIRRYPWTIFLMILIGGWMFLKLRQPTGDIAWAILLYILAIATMTLTALNREKAVPVMSFQLVAIGAVLFMLSDGLLAWNKFLRPIPYASVWIMLSYGLAQWAIVAGVVRQLRAEAEPTS